MTTTTGGSTVAVDVLVDGAELAGDVALVDGADVEGVAVAPVDGAEVGGAVVGGVVGGVDGGVVGGNLPESGALPKSWVVGRSAPGNTVFAGTMVTIR